MVERKAEHEGGGVAVGTGAEGALLQALSGRHNKYIPAVTFVTFVRLRQAGGAAEFLVVTDPAVCFGDLAQPGLKIPQPPPLPGALRA